MTLSLEVAWATPRWVSLRWEYTGVAPLQGPVRVYRSNNAVTGFEPVGETSQVVWIDPVDRLSRFNSWYYRVEATTATGAALSSPVATLQDLTDRTVLRLQKRERFQLAKYDGDGVWLYPRRRTGTPCPRCVPQGQAALGELGLQCTVCFNTGIEGGYYPPVPIYWAQQTLHSEGSNLLENRVKDSNNGGNAWTSNWTLVHPEDLLREANPPNNIWKVTGTQASERRGSTLRQIFTFNEVDRSQPYYQLPVPDFTFPDPAALFFQSWDGPDCDERWAQAIQAYLTTLQPAPPPSPPATPPSTPTKDRQSRAYR
jgi:hypothetical protein